jgi:hypothetical protein
MNSQVTIARSRGAVSGGALILLGLWGGLAPFVGPYFHFGYTPDKAWAWTSGRLYYSVIPGAVALVAGALLAVTRSRVLGVTAGTLAALAGGWFVLGSGITYYLLKHASITTGVPLGSAGSAGAYTVKMYLEVLALYGALGAVIIFFGALACGRLSLVAASDASGASSYYARTGSAGGPADGTYTTGQFPSVTPYQDTDSGQFPVAGEFPSAAGQFPTTTSSEQFTRPSVFPPRRLPFREPPTELPDNAPE